MNSMQGWVFFFYIKRPINVECDICKVTNYVGIYLTKLILAMVVNAYMVVMLADTWVLKTVLQGKNVLKSNLVQFQMGIDILQSNSFLLLTDFIFIF